MLEKKPENAMFDKQNYRWMIIGAVVVTLGLLLMSGGKSPDPKVFDYKEVYSFRRITIAPFLIIIGLIIEVYAIMRRPKA
ncbi:MAG: DUF3098 domain-containing protein [Bacteroidetes bacterium]|nr:MAG: DUF3098 domain-containing protein [Bacteroidota bacterium]